MKNNNILINDTQDGLKIENQLIDGSIFDEEKSDYRCIHKMEMIDELIQWISECGPDRGSDKSLMKDDLENLMNLEDKYIFSSISTNEYITNSDDAEEFYEICKDLLQQSGLTEAEADKLLTEEDLVSTDLTEGYCNICCMESTFDEEENCEVCGNHKSIDDVENSTSSVSVVFEIKQYDKMFSEFYCSFGTFTDRDEAIEAMMNGLEELYSGFKEDVYANGDNQWITDKHEFGIMLLESTLNVFEEV